MITFLARSEFLVLPCLGILCYGVLERTGLFRTEAATVREILHARPVLGASLLLGAHAMARLAVALAPGTPGPARWGRRLFALSLLLFVAALWTSVFTRFEGRAVRTENSTFNAFKQDYIPSTFHAAKFAELPEVGILVKKIVPVPSADLGRLEEITADVAYSGRTTGGILAGRLRSRSPLVSDWTFVTLTDFGYSIEYVLTDLKGRQLESNRVFMKLFPAGTEDYFEAMFLGYVFSVRLYPDAVEQGGALTTRSLDLANPVMHLRISRNKDIVYNGLLRPGERVRFDNTVILFKGADRWVELSLVRDLGMPAAGAAFVLMIFAGVLLSAGRRARTMAH
jgi:hypothetical protein